jgi:hypothetical protein
VAHVGHSERVRPASGKEAKKLGVFCGIKRGAAGGSTQRPAPLTTIEVEAGIKRWVGLGVIADNLLVNISRVMAKQPSR